MLEIIFGALALLSFGLFCWQWLLGIRFPLHQRVSSVGGHESFTILKPLKGCDSETEECQRSWLTQEYPAPVQVIFGVASPDDPVCDLVRKLNGELLLCPKPLGPNAKISTLVQLEPRIRHDLVVVSDADVWAPKDLLVQLSAQLRHASLACCFYQMPVGRTFGMRLEAFAANSDFWSQVLQSTALKPMDFALGAAMAIRREALARIGGFAPLLEFLADDYQLGNRVSQNGQKVAICPTVVDCRSAPMPWRDVWTHQLRWARTIRVCQPVPFFFSILSNPTIWPLLWLIASPSVYVTVAVVLMVQLRAIGGACLAWKLTRRFRANSIFIAPLSDLFRAVFWALAFTGKRIQWRGRKFRVSWGGKLVELK